MHPPALAPHSASLSNNCSFWAVHLNVVCTEAATWGRWPQIEQAHLFPQNVPQHGWEATAAPLVSRCKATLFQEHNCALFSAGIRSLLQIRDFLLCICGKKVWVSFIPRLPCLARDPVLFGGLSGCLCVHPLSCYPIECRLSQLPLCPQQPAWETLPVLPVAPRASMCIYSQTFLGWALWSSWSMFAKSSPTWPWQRPHTQLVLWQYWDV